MMARLLFLISAFNFLIPMNSWCATRAIMEGIAATSNTIFVDTTNVRVGIAKIGPTTALDVTGVVTATSYAGSGVALTGIPTVAQLTSTSAALTAEIARATARENAIGVSTGTIFANLNSTAAALTSEIARATARENAIGASTGAIAGSTGTLQADLATEVSNRQQADLAIGIATASVYSALQSTGASLSGHISLNGSAHGGIIPSSATGTYPLSITGTIPATNVSAGSLGSSVIASSITLAAMYGSPTLDGTNITGIPTIAQLTSTAAALSDHSALTTTAHGGIQASGNYITALTGNVTASGPGSVAATIVSVPQSAVNLSTVTTNHVLKSGDTMTGTLNGTSATMTGTVKAHYFDTTDTNIFIGNSAGAGHTTNSENVFIGALAGQVNTSGAYNTFIGGEVAYQNTTGGNNTFIGQAAGGYNLTANYNVGVGNSALLYGTGGSNVAVGYKAAFGSYPVTTSSSTVLGYQAGFSLTSGSSNTLVGYNSGNTLTTGGNNILIGNDVNAPSATTFNHLNIGGLITGTIGASSVTIPGTLYANSFSGSGVSLTGLVLKTGDTMTGALTVTEVLASSMTVDGNIYSPNGNYLSIEGSGIAGYVSQYPPEQNGTYVKATTYLGAFYPYLTTDPTKSLTGTNAGNQWISDSVVTNQRFHIDLGSAKIIERIYYENGHYFGGYVDNGVQNFTFWGSNDSADFNELTYATDGTWTQLTTAVSTFTQHPAVDVVDPHYIGVTNSTGYRYYAFKFVDTWGGVNYQQVRRIELQTYVEPTSPLVGIIVSTNMYVMGASSATAYYGDGSNLTGVLGTDSTKVSKSGDTMTGPLTLSGSSATITGNLSASQISASSVALSNQLIVLGSVTVAGSSGPFGLNVSSGLYVGGRVGVGVANPSNPLSFATALHVIAPETSDGSDTGYLQLWGGGGPLATRGAGISVFGNEIGSGLNGQVKIDAGNVVGGSVTIRTGNNVDRLTILYGGNIGIGTSSPSDILDISSGTIRLAGANSPAKGLALCLMPDGRMGTFADPTALAAGTCTAPY